MVYRYGSAVLVPIAALPTGREPPRCRDAFDAREPVWGARGRQSPVRPSRSSLLGPIPRLAAVRPGRPPPLDDDSFAVTISVAQVGYMRPRGTIPIAYQGRCRGRSTE